MSNLQASVMSNRISGGKSQNGSETLKKYACGLPCPHLRFIADFSVTIAILTCVGLSRIWQNTDMEMLRVPDVVEPSRKRARARIIGIDGVLDPLKSLLTLDEPKWH